MARENTHNTALKEIISQADRHLVSLSSNTYVFEDKMTKYQSVRPIIYFYLCHIRTCRLVFLPTPMGVVGWCDGAGSTSSAEASYNLDTVGQGPIALAVGAGGGVWTFLLSSILSLLFLPLFGRRLDID